MPGWHARCTRGGIDNTTREAGHKPAPPVISGCLNQTGAHDVQWKAKRAAIMARRRDRRAQAALAARATLAPVPSRPCGREPVDRQRLAPCNSYGEPEFARRGYYVDLPFTCRDCASQEVWTAAQQKWWYEEAKGYVDSTAVRCLACRRQRRGARMNNNKDNSIKAS